jgi:hypothetical protein
MSRLVYFGDIDKGYLTKLNRIYDSIEIITNEQAENFNWNYPERYTTGEDIFISRNYPQCLYYELEGGRYNDLVTYKVIGIRDACYDDESDDYESNTMFDRIDDETSATIANSPEPERTHELDDFMDFPYSDESGSVEVADGESSFSNTLYSASFVNKHYRSGKSFWGKNITKWGGSAPPYPLKK